MTPRIFDCFMFNDELDMLECRLTELAPVVDKFILVECTETHSGKPKRLVYRDHAARFKPWEHRIYATFINGLRETDPMKRDEEQRAAFRLALTAVEATHHDIILQSDVDEIPNRDLVENIEEHLWYFADRSNFLAFEQRLHCFAVDWEHPQGWRGTVAARYAHIHSFSEMRHSRETIPRLPKAGHHLSWLGGGDQAAKKLEDFAHQELIYLKSELARDTRRVSGLHVDGVWMLPVDVDDTYPEYIQKRLCPPSWFRPR